MPLTLSRKTPKVGQDTFAAFPQDQGVPVAANVGLYAGGVAMLATGAVGTGVIAAAIGNAVPGQTAPGLIPLGISQPSNPQTAADVFNTTSPANPSPVNGGPATPNGLYSYYVTPRTGEFLMNNGTAAWDVIAPQHTGQIAYSIDDQQVACSSAFASRSPVGVICGLETQTQTLPGGVLVEMAPGIAQLHPPSLAEVPLAATTILAALGETVIGRTNAPRMINGFSFASPTAVLTGALPLDATLQTWAKFQLGYRAPTAPGTLVIIGEVVLSGTTTVAGATLAAFAPTGLNLSGVPVYGPNANGAAYFGTQTQAAALAATGWGLGTITGQNPPFVPAGSVLTLSIIKGTTGAVTPAGTLSVF